MINDNNVKNATKESFWSVINKYFISIPRMQRNYAQGREEPEITQKRENLLNDIFESLEIDKTLDLNFIYGNVKNDEFIPIDGQQRLTTLFLLHWYLMILSGKTTDENVKILLKFTYETRDVTKLFCQRLVKDVRFDLENIEENDLTRAIKDYYWFFSDFELDPSISSMLVMLQSVHEKVIEIGFEKSKSFFDLLISKESPISFLFLNIDDVGLTDDIYIKMNARGKPLTEFENFKAQLTNYLSNKDKEFSDKILNKINGEWSQFFWSRLFKDGEKVVFDEHFMNLIKFIMFNDYICNNNAPNSSDRMKVRKTLTNLKNESTFEFTNRLFKDEFRDVYDFKNEHATVNEYTFRMLYKLLDALSLKYSKDDNLNFVNNDLYNKKFFDEDLLFSELIDPFSSSSLSYVDSILLYAEYAFISKYSEDGGEFYKTEELTSWIRYIYNLSKAQLYNAQDDYYRSVKSIHNMIQSDYALDILNYAANMTELVYRQGRGFGFYDLQAKDESIKAILILKGEEWKESIIEAENSYLDNQLSSIINFSGIEDIYDSNMDAFLKENPDELVIPNDYNLLDKVDIKKFNEYLYKITTFFDKDGLKVEYEKNSIFRRALLTFGDDDSYLLKNTAQNYSFLNNTHRDYGFRRLLRDSNDGKRIYFKMFLDSIYYEMNHKEIISHLQMLIDDFAKNNPKSWKYYFLTMPDILDCVDSKSKDYGKTDPSGNYVFKSDGGRFINKKSDDEILLCEGQSTRSTNRELYSYVLYLKAKELGFDVYYHKEHTETAKKYLYFNNKDDQRVNILYDKNIEDNIYKFAIQKNGEFIERNENIRYMLNYIRENTH
ncbi:MAG TPA: DUF262 domain-containing protein [Gallicola sp.]|nr:DUF262 domain-containing protein [Gallicola sp.]